MGLTPMMKQYLEVKETCSDCILFFRLGDFYEMFFEDAKTASKELELVLTGRDCGLEERAPMCGIPYHSANNYISRLVQKGYKIAICEQLENPSESSGIVKRGVIKVITPGTYTDSSFLEESKNNYIMSIYKEDNYGALCFADISTGEFNCTDSLFDINIIFDEISKFVPKEILILDTIEESFSNNILERFPEVVITKLKEEDFVLNARDNLLNQFNNFKEDEYKDVTIRACNGVLSYIMHTQKVVLSNINELNYYNIVDYLTIDINSRRNLELTENLREKTKKASLLWILDKTNTAMGARQLRRWVEQPLINKKSIQERLDAVEELTLNLFKHEDLKEDLKAIYDIERLVGKISSKSVNAKELVSLKNSIAKIPNIKNSLKGLSTSLFTKMEQEIDTLEDVFTLLDNSLLDNPSLTIKEGNILKDGFNQNVDELRFAKNNGKKWIASLEQQEKDFTGIRSLKVGYNKIFGYFIEITKANLNNIPEGRYIRKQTLANSERYITEELKDMENKILGAEEKLIDLEYRLFMSIREEIEKSIDRMKKTSRIISDIDCLSSLSTVALEQEYVKPNINTKDELYIKDGRHPVVEKVIPKGDFVSNDTFMDTKDDELLLITGPNMAGKSTYMRQVALITIMAQIGSFVPAAEANIGICDKIFTRIGASDDLAAGKSTFMVEMWEVSNILKNATSKSLVLLDEVGRGTSTFDGLSIAWAVIEHICKNSNLKCKTLFATHYHELTKLEGVIKGVKNYSVSVKELNDDIIFLRKIVRGGADQSYGIEVAKLAGLPKDVISRAKDILKDIEGQNQIAVDLNHEEKGTNVHHGKKEHFTPKKPLENTETLQMNFQDLRKDEILKEIKEIDILSMNPMEGFNKLYDIINKVKKLN